MDQDQTYCSLGRKRQEQINPLEPARLVTSELAANFPGWARRCFVGWNPFFWWIFWFCLVESFFGFVWWIFCFLHQVVGFVNGLTADTDCVLALFLPQLQRFRV